MRWVGAEQPRDCVVEASEGQWGREVSIGFHRFPRRTLPLCQVGPLPSQEERQLWRQRVWKDDEGWYIIQSGDLFIIDTLVLLGCWVIFALHGHGSNDWGTILDAICWEVE